MPTPPGKKPDRHYSFRRTNVVFAVSSLALLAVTGWMVLDDYNKPWKRFQAKFRSLEREKLAAEAEAERRRINETEIQQLQTEIQAAEEDLGARAGEIDEIEGLLEDLDKKIYVADSVQRKTKSYLDTERYQLDQALQRGSESEITALRAQVTERAARLEEELIELESLRTERTRKQQELDSLLAERAQAQERLAALRTGVASLEQRAAQLAKDTSYLLLNFPLMDFIEPDIKVEQVVLPGLYHNINFTNIDRVDRCMTCHVAANRPGFEGEEWEAPFRTHPRLDLFVGDGSPHPYNRYGCTSCHSGLDRATDFARAGHSPMSAEQRERWEREYDWEPQHYLETPILPADLSEARCISCHANGAWTPQSQRLEVGRQLMSRMGCFRCHQIDYAAFQDLPRPGPSLDVIAAKTNPGWAYRWIEAPREFRPTTWMPHFFFLENVVGEENLERQRIEIASIVAYLWDKSADREYPDPPPGDPERGEELFNTIGCTGCHLRDGEASRDDFFPVINRLHGPNLVNTGSKVNAGWLYAWLKNPKQHSPTTRMPRLRLTDQEAADITAHLMQSRDPEYEGLEVPRVDISLRDELVLGYLQNAETVEQSHASLEAMTDRERDVYLGGQTIQKYGCHSCHEIAEFMDAKPIGVELTTEGSKPLHQFDFGHVHEVPHTRYDWIRTKLLEPRIWDRGKETVKGYHELYKMPDFGMGDREAEAVLANVMGFTEESVVAERKADQGGRGEALAAGRNLITKYNCQGCHLIEGQGHAIRTSIEDPGMLPPNLASQGARVQPEWLFDYLHDPSSETMRPWLTVRMPTFDFSDDEINTVLTYFTERDHREPFISAKPPADPRDLAVGEVMFGLMQCARCHPSGPVAAGAVAADLAPSLLLAPERLRHDWIVDWIMDPQRWVPGTRMPTFFAQDRDGNFESPFVTAIDSPTYAAQKGELMQYFETEDELRQYLADVPRLSAALRDHIWALQ